RPLAIGSAAGGQRCCSARIAGSSGHVPPLYHDVQHNLEMLIVQLFDGSLGVWKCLGVPGELSIVSVPAVRAEVGSKINHRVARKLLLAERLGFLHNLFGSSQCAMRLLVTKR